ncbi:GNAT family N-acetyltransferase [Alterisphingorhabdus coralli]|uniref:GNAT family N-acetyltransferase n=1 Tax=Alterisphingorhabdus coralli TaxID=3071408 RepID=A0AA97F6N5_9SPHN|nr:GNAT family N-acetyltransferase [Parasphingorhabdus sp. SCSIO 66989]WOE74926.1 GNAT family N-acetyltransferase [Parasphingorhabdus sp. SCSIO 66989]
MQFRDYRSEDKAACLALFDSNVPRYFDPSERQLFSDFLDDPRGPYFVLELDGDTVGCGGYAREEPDADGTRAVTFTWGMVDNARHKEGLGKALAEHRLAVIRRESGLDEVRLSTTPAVAPFFARFGFVAGPVEKDGYAPGMDKVEMRMAL